MNLNIVSKEKAKTLVSALRRELQALNKGTAALSHNDCLTVLAKAQGFASWNAWEATLPSEKQEPELSKYPRTTDLAISAPSTDGTFLEGARLEGKFETLEPTSYAVAGDRIVEARVPAAVKPKYPLTNDGEFDFIAPGEEGVPLKGDFTSLDGTFELIEAKAYVVSASRAVDPRDKGIGGSGLNVQHRGSTTFDDTMETQVQGRNIMWLPDDGELYTGPVILVPMDCGDPEYDETLPVRAKLIEAYLAYYAERGIDDSARDGVFDRAAGMLGIHLTEREAEHLLDQLPVSE
jgi:hypothetical protein